MKKLVSTLALVAFLFTLNGYATVDNKDKKKKAKTEKSCSTEEKKGCSSEKKAGCCAAKKAEEKKA